MSASSDDPDVVKAFITWSHTSNAGAVAGDDQVFRQRADEAWRDQVYDLVTVLRQQGIDAELDLGHQHDPAVDWTRYGPIQIRERDIVLVAVNAAWRRAWEGTGPANIGAGATAEADELHGLFNDDREGFQRKVKLLQLPGTDDADLPSSLDRLARFRVPSLNRAGVEDLLRTLTNQPKWPLVELGRIPILPPAARAAIEHFEPSGASEPKSGATTRVTSTRSTTWNVAAPDLPGHLRDEIALLDSVLRQLPTPQLGEGPHLPWYREWERAQTQRARLQQQLDDL